MIFTPTTTGGASRLSDISLTAARYKSLFQETVRSSSQTYVEFCAKLTGYLDTYLELADVDNFESLKQLLLTDRLKDSLSVETKSVVHKEMLAKRVTAQTFCNDFRFFRD